MNTKTIIVGSLLAVIASLFQLIPFFFSEILVVLTIFSALPIYIISRINPRAGLLAYLTTGMIVMTLSVHEGLFFLCTNGIVGISLGICSYYRREKAIIWSISSIILVLTLSIMNYLIGTPILGVSIPGSIIVQIGIIFLISIIYNIFYYYFAGYIYKILKKNME